jgi:hypothetical protein
MAWRQFPFPWLVLLFVALETQALQRGGPDRLQWQGSRLDHAGTARGRRARREGQRRRREQRGSHKDTTGERGQHAGGHTGDASQHASGGNQHAATRCNDRGFFFHKNSHLYYIIDDSPIS